MEKSYKYLGHFFLLIIPLIYLAFHKRYLSKFPDFDQGFDNFIHFHAFMASLWVLILIVQPFLVVRKKLKWHRAVGKFSYVAFPLLILSFVPGIIKLVRAEEYIFIFYPLSDCLVLILLYSLAMYYKKKPQKHMRYIIGSSLPLLGPTIGRIGPIRMGLSEVESQTLQYAITFAILIGVILWDLTNKRNFRPYLVAVGAYIIHAIVFYVLFVGY